ncbi:Protein NRT1/ PTR FAMILY 8.3, partial [Ananas comosus]
MEEFGGGSSSYYKDFDWRAPAIVLGFVSLESLGFSGIATNLVIYLSRILCENNASIATSITAWTGTSYFTPFIGAVLADSYFGSYRMIFFSSLIYLAGMSVITLSALLPSLKPFSSNGYSCTSAIEAQKLLFYSGLYLIAFGSGGVKSSLLPFGASQFDDENPTERLKKESFFNWFYFCINVGTLISSTLIVWIQEDVSWAVGYGLSTLCIAAALGCFLVGRAIYKLREPGGSPLKRILQVIVASFRKANLKAPVDAASLYEVPDEISNIQGKQTLPHTEDYKFLDKAAIISDSDSEDGFNVSSWRLCTITQVEELKLLLRLFPIWLTSIVYSVAYAQMYTTFVEQGRAMDTKVGSFSVPPASLYAFEVVSVMLWVLLCNTLIADILRNYSCRLSHLQRIGVGYFLMILALAIAATVEGNRLKGVENGNRISILWQLPQYFVLGGSEVFSCIAQLALFYEQGPGTMRSMCTAISLLAVSLGNYLSSVVIMVVRFATKTGGGPGWIPDNLDEGHLDYFFWWLAGVCAVNFISYLACARRFNLKEDETSRDYKEEASSKSYKVTQLQHKPSDWRAPAIILGFECLDSTAFNGIATNLVVYLHTVLHGNNASNAANVTTWFGTSYFTPILGAIIADTYWGNYKTIFVSLVLYLLGMVLITLSPFAAAATSVTNGAQILVFYSGLYLVAFGSGGLRSALLPFGADQFDDNNPLDREKKSPFFSWFYVCMVFGSITSGTIIVWIQENIDWALGFGISTLCIALALGGFLSGTPTYRLLMPSGSPLKNICQVLVASLRKINLEVPADSSLLYEPNDETLHNSKQSKLAHTDEFRFLDKAAIINGSDLKGSNPKNSWKVCTVTQVEELKILLRLVPIWLTSIIYAAAYTQINTTFIQQGSVMNTKINSFFVPPASLVSFETVGVVAWVLLYNKYISPIIRKQLLHGSELSQLNRMGIGRFLIIIAMAIAALVETKRLDSVRNGEVISIIWQLPQYFVLAGSEVFSFITQLEFFYSQAPDSMKSICTSFALLAISLGSYLSSLIVTIVAVTTTTGGRPGWIPDDLNDGRLDYYFWSLTVLCAFNFI